MRGLGAAGFAFMFSLGGSTMAFLGAVHPFWDEDVEWCIEFPMGRKSIILMEPQK